MSMRMVYKCLRMFTKKRMPVNSKCYGIVYMFSLNLKGSIYFLNYYFCSKYDNILVQIIYMKVQLNNVTFQHSQIVRVVYHNL